MCGQSLAKVGWAWLCQLSVKKSSIFQLLYECTHPNPSFQQEQPKGMKDHGKGIQRSSTSHGISIIHFEQYEERSLENSQTVSPRASSCFMPNYCLNLWLSLRMMQAALQQTIAQRSSQKWSCLLRQNWGYVQSQKMMMRWMGLSCFLSLLVHSFTPQIKCGTARVGLVSFTFELKLMNFQFLTALTSLPNSALRLSAYLMRRLRTISASSTLND